MTIVGSSTSDREFVEAVARILIQIGEAEVTTLLNPTRRVSVAMDAVRDARDEVYYHTKWTFRRAFMEVEFVASQMWYELPSDYQEIATGIQLNRLEDPLPYLRYDHFIIKYPDLRTFPPGAGVGDLTIAGQAAAQTHNFGEPDFFTLQGGYIGLFPIPDSTFVTLEHMGFLSYWKQAPMLVSDNDTLGIPRELWLPCHLIALANMKRALGFGGWENDDAKGRLKLARESAGVQEAVDANKYHGDFLNYNE